MRTKNRKNAMNNYDDIVAFNQNNFDAMVASSTIFAKGFEQLTKEYVAFASASFETAVEASKQISTAKSINEAVDLQTKIAKDSWEKAVVEGQKISEISTVIFKNASAPLSERVQAGVNVANETAKKAAKATQKAA
jgi:phasin family protein